MTPHALAGKPGSHEFELLLHTYFSGWTGFAYDENDNPVSFSAVEEALADLQSAFDIWERQIRDAERAPNQSFSPDEFAIRCVTTSELCRLGIAEEKVVLRDENGVPINSPSDLARINLTGRFKLK